MPGITSYDKQTMFGPSDKPSRKRLTPGMRLGDGRVFTGVGGIEHIEVLIAELDKQMAAMQAERANLVAQLERTKPEAEKPTKKSTKKSVENE